MIFSCGPASASSGRRRERLVDRRIRAFQRRRQRHDFGREIVDLLAQQRVAAPLVAPFLGLRRARARRDPSCSFLFSRVSAVSLASSRSRSSESLAIAFSISSPLAPESSVDICSVMIGELGLQLDLVLLRPRSASVELRPRRPIALELLAQPRQFALAAVELLLAVGERGEHALELLFELGAFLRSPFSASRAALLSAAISCMRRSASLRWPRSNCMSLASFSTSVSRTTSSIWRLLAAKLASS